MRGSVVNFGNDGESIPRFTSRYPRVDNLKGLSHQIFRGLFGNVVEPEPQGADTFGRSRSWSRNMKFRLRVRLK